MTRHGYRAGAILLAAFLGGCATSATRLPPSPIPPDAPVLRTVAPTRPVTEIVAQIHSPEPALWAAALYEISGASRVEDDVKAAVSARLTDDHQEVREATTWASSRLRSEKERKALADTRTVDDTPPRPRRKSLDRTTRGMLLT